MVGVPAPGIADRWVPGRAAMPAVQRTIVVGVASLGFLSLLCALGALAVPLFNMELFNRVLTTRNTDTLIAMAVGLVVCLLIYGVQCNLRDRALSVIADRIASMLSVPVVEVASASSGGTASAMQSLRDLETLRTFLASPVCLAPFDLAWTPLLLGVFLWMHWAYAALAAACVVALCLLNLLGDVVTRRQILAANDASARSHRTVASAVAASEAVIAMNMLPAISAIWDRTQRQTLDLSHRAMIRAKLVASVMRAARLAMTAAMVALGLVLVLDGYASPGSMVAANMILAKLLQPLQSIENTRRTWMDATAAWKRIRETLETSVPVRYGLSLPRPEGRLSVDRLFHVPSGADRPVLRGLTFDVAPGEILCVIGPAAAGKTTLVRMLLGMETPTGGGVYLDGHPVHLWERSDFARHVGHVPQTISLVEGTIAENIASMADPDPGAVVDAARAAGIHDAVAALPHGYSTRILPGGTTLSSGQRQRLALARAVYGDPRLLILDEPNAFMDEAGEETILALLRRMKSKGVGAVVVTHRPSLASGADRILVLRDGLVERIGDRDDVVRSLSTPSVSLVRSAEKAAAS